MMYRMKMEDRKQAIRKIQELVGEKPAYTGMPRCAYILRGIALEKDGTVTIEADADEELLSQLVSGEILERVEETPAAIQTVEIPDGDEAEETEEEEAEVQDADEPEKANEAPVDRYADLVEDKPPVKPIIALPMKGHTEDSLRNLVFTLYSRGSLISKATGGTFHVSKNMVEILQSSEMIRLSAVVDAIENAGPDDLQGMTIDDDKVIFDGFPVCDDPEVIKAWTVLCVAINKTAKKQRHVHARAVDETNERFAFRTWMNRIGMGGPDVKPQRLILYRNLSGHTAFRTPVDEAKWRERQTAKREELHAKKAEALANDNTDYD